MPAGLLMFVFYRIDADDAEYFFDRLYSGEMLAKGDPIFELRRTLKNFDSSKGQKSMTYVAAITIKAWNKYRNGETCSFIKFVTGGANPEDFPEPK